MKKEWITSIKAIMLMTLICGVIYPLSIWVIGQTTMNKQANGSLLKEDGTVIGSSLIGQTFTEDNYFWSRPSCAINDGTLVGSGSNASVTSSQYQEVLQERISKFQSTNKGELIPVELVTCSASGLDPHISYGAAMFQASRVAKARNLDIETVEALIGTHVEKQWMNLFGNSYVNVLQLNYALDLK